MQELQATWTALKLGGLIIVPLSLLAVIALAGWAIQRRFRGRAAPAARLRDDAQAATG